MAESGLPFKKRYCGAEIVASEDLIGMAHPSGGISDDGSITVAELAKAIAAELGLSTGLSVADRYLLAVTGTAAHQKQNVGYAVLATLPEEAIQATANARANALKGYAAAHAASVGTTTSDGAHLVADGAAAVTLAAVPAASSLATCITLINALFAWHQAHAIQSGTHFHNDTVPAGDALTVDPPVTLADCIADLNDLVTMMQAHFATGIA